jgi:hypothetical protein
VLVRVEIDPGHVTLEATGCLTQANYPVLLHIMRRSRRLAPGQALTIDLRQTSHLDPEVLMYLRHLAGPGEKATLNELPVNNAEVFPLTLAEPAEVPICLDHAGLTAGTQPGLDGEIRSLLDGDSSLGLDLDGVRGTEEQRTINGLELLEYLEGNLDPASTVLALSDEALGQLVDALYRHLDTRSPSFGAHTWYELASEELHKRHLAGPEGEQDGPAQEELAAG